MMGTRFPSGDPAADRRASYAEMLVHIGDLGAAIEVFAGTMDLVPGWAAGWFRLGELLEGAGAVEEACAAWDKAVIADPADPLGAGLKRDLLRRVPVTDTMPSAFVELLFDQYAHRFETSLVDKLAYRGPALIADALTRAGVGYASRVLDLGCGTGLAGVVLRERSGWLGGYDISENMLAEAAEKGIYDLLEKRDLSTLELGAERYDLIVAADVFIYLGALERILGWCADALAPGGTLTFTVELGEAPVELRESRRFAHSRAYVEGLLADAGFALVQIEDCVLRQDRGSDVASLCVVASALMQRPEREGDQVVRTLA
ncbi:methyltransferase domain-containing protein [Pseudooceanicola sp. CBS1P-1]|uniref:Methyltransferase domain-containing protein n=1 Tax=Pseudooceanicola albus TaxID=2692189 RepID=A0A6L7FYD1_9RHOB|nr:MULTISPECIES: methyltransferase [Pseudooceanicola]MBT9385721.1 methyltransferase domain-containing protein [Pseudooceanicola endophyticus]MXN16755.1 methyltransferase domain-containing protein [Pseudooceanicola albus]